MLLSFFVDKRIDYKSALFSSFKSINEELDGNMFGTPMLDPDPEIPGKLRAGGSGGGGSNNELKDGGGGRLSPFNSEGGGGGKRLPE